MSTPESPGGLFSSLRQMLDTVLEIAQVRLKLLGNELQQEKLRVFDGLMMAIAGLMVLMVGAVLLCALVLMLFAPAYRLAALSVMTLVFLAAGLWLIRAGQRRLSKSGGPFDATLSELDQDRKGLVPRE